MCRKELLILCCMIGALSCDHVTPSNEPIKDSLLVSDSSFGIEPVPISDTALPTDTSKKILNELSVSATTINTGNVRPAEVIRFAATLQGVPYVYGSSDPKVGFDCSGFITYVFNHFNINVPRSSYEFTNVGELVEEKEAKTGDVILFAGTNPAERTVGHMGLIVSNTDSIRFIHSTSGKAMSVVVTPLNAYYRQRFVSIRRIFKGQ